MPQPDKPKLYNQLKEQATARWPSHKGPNFLSWPASKWFGQEYAREGGGFTDSINNVKPEDRDYEQEAKDKEKREQEDKKAKLKKRGFVV